MSPVDVLAVLQQIADGEGDVELLAMRVRVAVAELIESSSCVIADVRAGIEPDLILLADCIDAAGGKATRKAALARVQGGAK